MSISQTPAPQAYTRDTITQAYEWLQTQPSHIRELANNIDGMVSMFLQARRRNGQTPSVTGSPQSFKQDLKNLAEGLRQFEEKAAIQDSTQSILNTFASPLAPQAPAQNLVPPVPPVSAPVSAPAPLPMAPTPTQGAPDQKSTYQLDSKTLATLAQVRTRLNLSTDYEALRMLVVLGSERLNDILPKH